MEGFPENTFIEEPVVVQVPDVTMETRDEAPLSKREIMTMEADNETAGFIRSITEQSPAR